MTPPAALDVAECTCDPDGDWWACVEGRLYGPCEHERCTGVCEHVGQCGHECHRESA